MLGHGQREQPERRGHLFALSPPSTDTRLWAPRPQSETREPRETAR